jgi:hypothetical protein
MQPECPRTLTFFPSAGEKEWQRAPFEISERSRAVDRRSSALSRRTILPLPVGRGERRGEGTFSAHTHRSVISAPCLGFFSLAALLLLATCLARADDGAYRLLGYSYLSPSPGAEYSSPQTKFVLMRFQSVSPLAVTNLSTCITVSGARSGNHTGQTRIATDSRTVIFTMSADFQANELVTVSLSPQTASGALQPYQYQFMISGHMPDPAVIAARGENPPNETKEKAFDGNPASRWVDLVVPNGSANFSWLQMLYPGQETHVVNQYALRSATNAPERDPQDWRLYGVDTATKVVLLDTRTNQAFGSRSQRIAFTFTNVLAFHGYRLEITRVANPATATAVQLAELGFIEPTPGSVLSPWTGENALTLLAAPEVTDGNSGSDQSTNTWVPPSYETKDPSGSGTIGMKGGTSQLLSLASPGKAGLMPNGVSVPSDFPFINITTNNNPDPEYIFLDNRGGSGKNYNVIFDNSGCPIWYRKMPGERRDMKVQCNGMLTMLARTGGYRFVGLNTQYEEVTQYWATNGYRVDEQELQVLADGTYFLVGLRTETVDMSRYIAGGNPAASVTEQVLQQFTPAGELIFQWRAWDHINILDQQSFINILGTGFDFPHMTAIDVDTDGHILLSSRSTSEITKINRETGEIIWRFGGVNNQFTFVNDPLSGPRNQCAIRCVGTNRYLLFDNGNQHSPSVSRGVEYELNPSNMTATIRWQYPPTTTTSLYSFHMGNAQRLPNGNTLINWAVGNLPKLTEVRPNGSKAFEMNWVDGYEAYRVWRCAWQGNALKPNLVIESYPDKVLLLFNKFGDTNVSYYRIYGGTASAPTNVFATTPITMVSLVNLTNQVTYYFRVTAMDKSGTESVASDEQSVLVDLVKPGENQVANGDFALGTNSWTLTLSGTATAALKITNGAAFVDITNAGTALSNIQLWQAGLRLIQGQQYVLEFDAWADAARSMEVKLLMRQLPSTTYKVVTSALTTSKQHFSYRFTMTNATDLNTRLAFNLGTSAIDVYFDNVSLYTVAPGDFNRDIAVNLDDLSVFAAQWLKQTSGLAPDLDGDGNVDFNDFSILGENWSGSP